MCFCRADSARVAFGAAKLSAVRLHVGWREDIDLENSENVNTPLSVTFLKCLPNGAVLFCGLGTKEEYVCV